MRTEGEVMVGGTLDRWTTVRWWRSSSSCLGNVTTLALPLEIDAKAGRNMVLLYESILWSHLHHSTKNNVNMAVMTHG